MMYFEDLQYYTKPGAYIQVYAEGTEYKGEFKGIVPCRDDECWMHPANDDICPGCVAIEVGLINDIIPEKGLERQLCVSYMEPPEDDYDYDDLPALEVDCDVIYPEGLGINKVVVC